MRHSLFILAALLLGACGTKGPLVLPPGPAKPPLFGNPTPEKLAEKKPEAAKPAATNVTQNSAPNVSVDNNNKVSEGQQ